VYFCFNSLEKVVITEERLKCSSRLYFVFKCAEIIEEVKLASLSMEEDSKKAREKSGWTLFFLFCFAMLNCLAVADYNVLFCRQETFNLVDDRPVLKRF
jgi:hypothetical protein